MKIRLVLGALSALAAGFMFSAVVHHDKWIHIDQNNVIVGTPGFENYVGVWHGNGDGGFHLRALGYCANSNLIWQIDTDRC